MSARRAWRGSFPLWAQHFGERYVLPWLATETVQAVAMQPQRRVGGDAAQGSPAAGTPVQPRDDPPAPPTQPNEAIAADLQAMGFDLAMAREALRQTNNDVARAVDLLVAQTAR